MLLSYFSVNNYAILLIHNEILNLNLHIFFTLARVFLSLLKLLC